jgi:hypothetical protein
VNLTALDRRVTAECRADNFAQRLGAIDDEQPADLRVEAALNQIVDERLDDGCILGRPFDQAERVFMALASGEDRGVVTLVACSAGLVLGRL